jgi:metacaspase-1
VEPAVTARALSLHIGLNRLSEEAYPGDGALSAAEADAHAMEGVAAGQGFKTNSLLTEDATREAVAGRLTEMSRVLHAGDLAFVSFAGHGGQKPDRDGDEPERPQGLDETWALFDGEMIDDELHDRISAFTGGARLLIVSDSCFSGSIATVAVNASKDQQERKPRKRSRRGEFVASVILLSAAQDDENAHGDSEHGFFTRALLDVWRDGAFEGTYGDYFTRVAARVSGQRPRYSAMGRDVSSFEMMRPYTP